MFGQLKESQEMKLEEVNQELIRSGDFMDVEDLDIKLEEFKRQFMPYDLDMSGDIDIMELKMMMESLDQAKTHLGLKKMIQEVDTTATGTITYRDFLQMMLGKANSVLKMVFTFEAKMREKERPSGPAPNRDLSSLP